MKLYERFRTSSLDTLPIGLWTGPDTSEDVFTPTGSRVVAWLAESDIHFCLVEGFGDTVFVVDPKAPPGDCVYPVARSMAEWIGLILSCGHAGVIAGTYALSRVQFLRQIQTVRPDYKTRSVLRALENTYHPPKISDPYGYILDLQASFDHSALPLHPSYYEWCPIRPGGLRWNVGFGKGFFEWCDKAKAGQEMALDRHFQWEDERWQVPAVYLCEDGIVVDSVLAVSGEAMIAFDEKWGAKSADMLSVEEQMRRALDDPLGVQATGSLLVNGRPAPLKKSFVLRWDPVGDNDWSARRTLEHYGLDREKGYLLRRECFLRKGKNPPIRSLELQLEAAPVQVPGQRFNAPENGKTLDFTDPSTGQVHTLKVLSQTRESLDPNFLSNHPCCYTRLNFTLDPPISPEEFQIVDCDPGDPFPGSRQAAAAAFPAGKIPPVGHFAVSSLRHVPARNILWRMVFRQKLRQDLSVPLLP